MSETVLYDVQGPKARRRVLLGSILGALLVAVLLGLAVRRLAANEQFAADLYLPFVEEPDLYRRLWTGLRNTLKAAAYALVLALVLGTVLAFGRLSGRTFLRVPAIAIIEFFRGVPLLLLILFFFLAFPLAFGIDVPPLYALVFGLTLYNGAVIAEIIRAGVLSLPKGQTEAALATGLTRGQTLRLVLLPQAVRIMLPALVSQLVVLLKDTSLGFVIGFEELLRIGGQAVQVLGNPIQLYVLIALIYITINIALGRLAGYLEGRQRRTYGSAVPAQTVESGLGQAGGAPP
ncbi:MAG: amino acid ABC transporter permease [Actinomycetota bacterium]|nr:amino acid ABC transporter permease [Actinomycetota bacterium]